eukprot:COSAG05_NODE_642_length_8135_cov_20.343703_1_plen_123_part_00
MQLRAYQNIGEFKVKYLISGIFRYSDLFLGGRYSRKVLTASVERTRRKAWTMQETDPICVYSVFRNHAKLIFTYILYARIQDDYNSIETRDPTCVEGARCTSQPQCWYASQPSSSIDHSLSA